MQPVLNALAIVEKIAAHQPIGVSELARHVGLPKSTTHRYLMALRDGGWIDLQSADPPRWQMSAQSHAILRPSATELTLREVAIPVMQRLRDESGETVFLSALEGTDSVLIERVDGTQPVRTFNPLGVRMQLNGPSTGKALLAALDPAYAEQIIAHHTKIYTEKTITSAAVLRTELEEIRQRGFAVNNGEWRPEVAGIGSVVVSPRGMPIAAVSISMPSFRFDPAEIPRLGELVKQGAREISDALAAGY